MQDQIYNMLLQKDEVTWQSLIYDLVRTEQLDPWNIDISMLTQRYMETVQKMREHSLFISGKVLLASAILLKIKSYKLVDEYIADLDNQLFPHEEDVFSEDDDPVKDYIKYEAPNLLVKTPQQRKRQLTLNDLMKALENALEVETRRNRKVFDRVIAEAVIPERPIDISELIHNVYEKIKSWFASKERLTFAELVGSEKKADKIFTFIPLLHLDSQQKVDLKQEKNFGEIEITIPK